MKSTIRADHRTILDWVPEGSKVLDLGCGEGDLLALLQAEKKVRGVGLELSTECVAGCISRGVSAYQGDLDQGLADLRSQSYDVVILNQALQVTRKPRDIMEEALRVGRRIIVGFPNFGYWRVRFDVVRGRTPQTHDLPFAWYDTPNFHFVSTLDFYDFVDEDGLEILREAHFNGEHRIPLLPNLLATNSLFELKAIGDKHA